MYEENNMKNICNELAKLAPELKNMIDDSITTGIERGAKFCVRDNVIKLTEICSGTECSIDLKKTRCSTDEQEIADIHTHPNIGKYFSRMSAIDVLRGIKEKKFRCIGFGEDALKKVTCYNYPFGVQNKLADEFKELYKEIDRYFTEGDIEYIPKPTTTEAQIKYMTDKERYILNITDKIMEIASKEESHEERRKNSCTFQV